MGLVGRGLLAVTGFPAFVLLLFMVPAGARREFTMNVLLLHEVLFLYFGIELLLRLVKRRFRPALRSAAFLAWTTVSLALLLPALAR